MLIDRLNADVKEAMKAREALRRDPAAALSAAREAREGFAAVADPLLRAEAERGKRG